MSSPLSQLPIGSRRKLAATLGLFAALFVAVGAVSAAAPGGAHSGAAGPVFTVVALVVALLLAAIALGVHHSVTIDVAEQRLEQAIEATVAARGGPAALCGCGHDHDPDELHVTDGDQPDPECRHDGSGGACAHNCDACALAAMRPSPSQTRSQRVGG